MKWKGPLLHRLIVRIKMKSWIEEVQYNKWLLLLFFCIFFVVVSSLCDPSALDLEPPQLTVTKHNDSYSLGSG